MNAVMKRSALILTLAAVSMGHSALTYADPVDRTPGSIPSITLSYSELDISKPQGLETLYTRIKRAARSVCGIERSPTTMFRGRQAMACYQTTVEDAVRQANRPRLTALHRARTKSAFG